MCLEQVSVSLVPVDLRVVVELHLPCCGLGPCEAGLLAGLLAHDWSPRSKPGRARAAAASLPPPGGSSLQLLGLAGNPLGPAGCALLARAVAGKPLRYPFTNGGGYSGGGVLHPRGGPAALPSSARAGGSRYASPSPDPLALAFPVPSVRSVPFFVEALSLSLSMPPTPSFEANGL
jgi:hypothetical protein